MELRRRQVDAYSTENVEIVQEALEETEEEIESEGSEIPPRSATHGRKKRGSARKKRSQLVAWLVFVLLAFGGAYWFLGEGGTERTIQATASLTRLLEEESQDPAEKHEVFNGVEVNTQPDRVEAAAIVDQDKEDKPAPQPQQENTVQPIPEPAEPAPVKEEVKVPSFDRIAKHKVEAGETLYRISVKYYSSGRYANFLARHNNLNKPSDLISGTYIHVPFPPLK